MRCGLLSKFFDHSFVLRIMRCVSLIPVLRHSSRTMNINEDWLTDWLTYLLTYLRTYLHALLSFTNIFSYFVTFLITGRFLFFFDRFPFSRLLRCGALVSAVFSLTNYTVVSLHFRFISNSSIHKQIPYRHNLRALNLTCRCCRYSIDMTTADSILAFLCSYPRLDSNYWSMNWTWIEQLQWRLKGGWLYTGGWLSRGMRGGIIVRLPVHFS